MRVSIILLLLNSCAFDQTLQYKVPLEIQPIVDDFIEDGKKRGRDFSFIKDRLVIEYVDNFQYKAYCNVEGDQIYIRLNTDYNRYNLVYHPQRVKGVIYHELGHGVLKRRHNNEFSLMGWATEFCESEDDKWHELVDELFKK